MCATFKKTVVRIFKTFFFSSEFLHIFFILMSNIPFMENILRHVSLKSNEHFELFDNILVY